MKLTTKLLGYLNRVFDKDPAQVLALRLAYNGSDMRWTVSDGVLTTTVVGGSGVGLTIDLSTQTVGQLAAYLASQPGYSVPYVDASVLVGKSALVLLDGTNNQASSNGDHLYGYTSVLWAYMEAMSNQLTLIRAAISEALLQMSANTAEGEWVDVHGVYYNVLRNQGEADAQYAARIVAEVLQARGNNVAIGEALRIAVGASAATVTDYGTITTSTGGTKSYGLFDVEIDSTTDTTMGADQDALVRALIEALRDAGTFLRKLKYVRKSPWLAYGGAALFVGENCTVNFNALVANGLYYADGSQNADGVVN